MFYMLEYATSINGLKIVSITSQKSVYERWLKDEVNRLRDCRVSEVDRVSITINECP